MRTDGNRVAFPNENVCMVIIVVAVLTQHAVRLEMSRGVCGEYRQAPLLMPAKTLIAIDQDIQRSPHLTLCITRGVFALPARSPPSPRWHQTSYSCSNYV